MAKQAYPCWLRDESKLTNSYSLDLAKTFTVLVGNEAKAFILYEELFKKRSSFFKAAFSEQWINQEKVVKLPEEDTELFNTYLNCVLFGSLTEAEDAVVEPGMRSVLQLYVLADKLGDLRVANLCADHIEQECAEGRGTLTCSDVEFCYCNSPKDSILRGLCVNMFVYELDSEKYLKAKPGFPMEFKSDLSTALMKIKHAEEAKSTSSTRYSMRMGGYFWTWRNVCYFHAHDEEFNPRCGGGLSPLTDVID